MKITPIIVFCVILMVIAAGFLGSRLPDPTLDERLKGKEKEVVELENLIGELNKRISELEAAQKPEPPARAPDFDYKALYEIQLNEARQWKEIAARHLTEHPSFSSPKEVSITPTPSPRAFTAGYTPWPDAAPGYVSPASKNYDHGPVSVSGYTRKDGTFVHSYTRSK